jgi:hypothetical protein
MSALPIDRETRALALAKACCELEAIESGDVLPHWEDRSVEYQTEMVDFAREILKGRSPQMAHDLWVVAMLRAGWSVGPEYDAIAKTDPRILFWEDYPDTIRSALVRAAQVMIALNSI